MRVLLLCITVLLVACDGPPDKVVEYELPAGPDRYRDREHGAEEWFAIGALQPVSRIPANGIAQAQYFENGTYRLSVELNVRLAPEGTFYEVWLLSEDGGMQSMGELRQVERDERHALLREEQSDVRESRTVLITRQIAGGDPAPGQAIAEGTLSPRERQ